MTKPNFRLLSLASRMLTLLDQLLRKIRSQSLLLANIKIKKQRKNIVRLNKLRDPGPTAGSRLLDRRSVEAVQMLRS